MVINKKYNPQYYQSLELWNKIACENIDILKQSLHAPYCINKDFKSVESAIISSYNKNLDILYFGCGIGRNLPFLKRIGRRIDGLDLPNMIKRCKKHTKGFSNLYSDISECSNNYSLVFDVFSLQFIPDINAIKDLLINFATMADYFNITTRNYIEDICHSSILNIIDSTECFELIDSTININEFYNTSNDIYGEFLFKSKLKERILDINSDSYIYSIDHSNKLSIPLDSKLASKNNVIILKSTQNNIVDNSYIDIAFLNASHSTIHGSTYYNYTIAYQLLQSGYTVKMYTNNIDNLIHKNFYLYNGTQIDNNILYQKICDIEKIEIPYANCFMAVRGNNAINALRLGAKYHKPVYILVYDCPLWFDSIDLRQHVYTLNESIINEYNTSVIGETNIYKDLKDKIHYYYAQIPEIKIIVLTENSINDWSRFFDLDVSHFMCIHPVVNNRIIEKIATLNKKNQIVTISRNCWNKGLLETLQVFREFSNDYILHIVTDCVEPIENYIQQADINRTSIVIHTNISDADKFILIKESKCLLSNSIFEGFGLWTIEALSCGTPVICYDLDSLKDINDHGIYKITKFNIKKFRDCVRSILKNNIKIEAVNKYNLEDKHIDIHFDIQKENFTLDTYVKPIVTTQFDTNPVVFHFNSIYNPRTCIQTDDSIRSWNILLNNINTSSKIKLNKKLHIFTFNNKPVESILEWSCNRQNIPINTLGKNLRFWSHNNRIALIIEYLESINSDYVIHIDALDAVIYGNINKILEHDINDTILFNAEEVCHPSSKEIESKQSARISTSPFKFLNGGVFFGRRKKMIEVFKYAQQYNKYKSDNPACDDCDQGKFNQVYIDRPDMISIDSMCKLFYCNDYKTNAAQWLIFNE